MDIDKGSIYKLLNGQSQYVIPVYQRKYSWNADEQCARLWKDIVNMVKQKKQHHFVGSIVNVAETNSPMGLNKYLIIDGQQRMTTLSLLMIALRDYLIATGKDADADTSITNMILKNPNRKGEQAYKMLLTDTDRDVMIKLIDKFPIKENEDSKIYQNYLYFKDRVAEGVLTPQEIYESIAKLLIVSITLDKSQGDEPQLIFESLNSTGMDLSKSDLIRNFILMGLDNDEQISLYKNYWKPLEDFFPSEGRSDKMDRFFRDYLVMKKSTKEIKFGLIYEEIKEFASNSEFATSLELAEDLYKYGDLYTNIINDEKKLPAGETVLKPIFDEMRGLRMELTYPFLMRVYMDMRKGLLTVNDFIEILKIAISYVVRRSVCEIPANSFNKTFANMGKDINPDDYLNSVKAAFLLLDSYKRFPRNEEFTVALKERNMYKIRISKYIYVKLENYGNKEPITSTGYTIEHILPQNENMRDEWKVALGENYKEIQEKYINSLGNLTLTRYNSEMGDKPFNEKVEVYKESAMHNLNKYVSQQNTWNKETIEERTKQLAECSCKVWDIPYLSEEILNQYNPKDERPKQIFDINHYNFDNEFVKMLYDKLDEAIKEIAPKSKVEYKKMYIAYKLKTNFVDVVVQKSRLRLSVNLDFDEVYDPYNICRDVTDLGRWGNGDVEIGFDSLDMLDKIMEIIEQAIEKQGV